MLSALAFDEYVQAPCWLLSVLLRFLSGPLVKDNISGYLNCDPRVGGLLLVQRLIKMYLLSVTLVIPKKLIYCTY